MRSRIRPLLLLFFGLSLSMGVAVRAQTLAPEARSYFQDWLAVCTTSSGCSASTYVFKSRDTNIVDYQLRLVPAKGGSGYRITVLTSSHIPDGRSDLILRVDGNAAHRLAAGSGYQRLQDGQGASLALSASTERLLREMRAGGRLAMRYRDEDGQAQRVSFSLWGLTASMDFMAEQLRKSAPRRNRPAGAALAKGDWSRYLGAFLPAMRRCLVATPGGPAQVSKAWPMNRGMIGVRTLGPDGRRWDCAVETESRDLAMFEAVPEGEAALPGEGMPLFTPPGQRPPEEERCYRHNRGFDKGGDFAGWLSYPNC